MIMKIYSIGRFFILFGLLALLPACTDSADPVASGDIVGILEVSAPASQGLDTGKLDAMDVRINAGDYGEIHSVLIIRNNHLVWEKYFAEQNRESLHDVYSVTKSVTSLAVGIAQSQGKIGELDTPLLQYFPNYEIQNDIRIKENIQLAHVLEMSAGFRWDEWTNLYGHPQNDATMLSRSNHWIQHMLDLTMAEVPGAAFTYNSGCTMLLSGILETETGKSAEDYTAENLFAKIGITNWQWDDGPRGLTNTGWGLHLRPLDMAFIGYLCLKNGNWNGEQVVPGNWIKTATLSKIAASPNFDYAYQWWRFADGTSTISGLVENDVYFAWGFGGQFIFVVPHLDMVVVSTAANFENSSPTFGFLRDYIFAAVEHTSVLAE